MINPIDKAIQYYDKFQNQILEKTQLQRLLGFLNNILEFYQDFTKSANLCLIDSKAILHNGHKNILPWSKKLKKYVQTLPCLGIPSSDSFKIIETNASNIGYEGILKQKLRLESLEQIF
ncbi:hypothetical protein I3842_04G122300 [Carya illinoinensis]|uniref:Reverse transcriptase/retrotransposon-derived protein RNase H-like domain-containing protein n=1 Tax=Carya illinoinensis TaxID=32201 RepID=A0A922FC76_CARIL|nr:hypothetical protein I3842_04G122300 [Carya illinoinensis]